MKRNPYSAVAAGLLLLVGAATPSLGAEPLQATMVPDPEAANGGTFTIEIISSDQCPDCPIGVGTVVVNDTSAFEVTFNRDTTELSILEGLLAIDDFEVNFNPGRIQITDATVGTDPEVAPDVVVVGSNSGEFVVDLAGLINATATIFGQSETFEDQGGTVEVAGVFTFDPVLGTFAITEVGTTFGPEVVVIEFPNPDNNVELEITGEFELNFIATGVLDVFEEDFESGDTGGWSVVVPRI